MNIITLTKRYQICSFTVEFCMNFKIFNNHVLTQNFKISCKYTQSGKSDMLYSKENANNTMYTNFHNVLFTI